jgi:DNA polymerase III subunit alpha
MTEFVHLHVHSEYSLLDGLPHPEQLAERAQELNQPAVAITDHGTMFAAIEFHDAARAIGVKPLIGIETYLAPRGRQDRDPKLDRSAYHLLLLAENEAGYRNLMHLASVAQLEGFYYYPRVDKEILAQYAEGIIATTGCLAAEIPQLLVQGRRDAARETLAWYREVFKDRFYVELQEHGIPELQQINPELIALAREFNLQLVATNDAHYLKAEDWFAQDILICIQTGTTVNATDRMRMAGRDYYFKSSEEMAELWKDYPEALKNTLEIAERCTLDLTRKGYHLPHFPVPEGYAPETYLRVWCERGLNARYGDRLDDTIRERCNYELGVIHQMGFDTYFLIVWDLTRHAREKDIWYNVRGSGAGSIVAYCLGITNLDPLEHNLIFERFLNPGRISMPDIDLDFPDDQRDEMIRYTVQKYGKDNVAQIITFGKLLAKAALRDVGRALDYPLTEVDRVAKLIPVGPGQTIEGSLEKIPEFRELYESNEYTRKLVDTAKLLEGVARHASTHAAGVVVADRPIEEYTPLHRPTRGDSSGFAVTQFPMGDLEHIGLLKIDFLGLATLKIMRKACDLIAARHDVHFDLSNIPVEDDEAFKLLSRGDVTGVFQVEGAGMRRVLTNMRPSKFDHIVATNALFRPGPMENIPTYIKRLHGEEPIEYKHPKLEPILAETYGIIVYQEQIIRIAVELAGYKPGEADDIRKAVGKKIREKIEAHRAKFIAGAVANGVDRKVAESVYGDIEFFARYGFNKAHAADYAVLTCQTAYLKAHYPLEYTCALLENEIGNLEKVAVLVAEARRTGIPILAPDVRYSDVGFVIDEEQNDERISQSVDSHGDMHSSPGIRFGLNAIKNVGAGAVQVIVNARQEGGPFTSLDDFCRRVDLRQVNRRVLESLIKAGALIGFGHREQLLKVVDRMIAVSASHHEASALGQMSLFGTALPADTFGQLPKVADMDNRAKLELEKESMGVYFSEHPLLKMAAQGKQLVTAFSSDLGEESEGHVVILGGVVSAVRVINTKKGDAMAFFNLEDPQGTIEVTAFPRTFVHARELIRDEALVLVKGKVQVRDNKVNVLADSVSQYPMPGAQENLTPNPSPVQRERGEGEGISDRRPTTMDAKPPATVSLNQIGALPAPAMAATPNEPVDLSAFDDWVPPPEELEFGMMEEGELEDATSSAESAAGEEGQGNAETEGTGQLEESQAATAATEPLPPAPPLPELKLNAGITIPSKANGGDDASNGKAEDHAKNGGAHAGSKRGNGNTPPARPTPREARPLYAAPPAGGRLLRVRIRRSNDADLDVQRMRGLVALLRSAEGRDRFSLIVPQASGQVSLDFPNFYTDYDALAGDLQEMIAEWGELELQ